MKPYLLFHAHVAGSLLASVVIAGLAWYLFLVEAIEADIKRLRK